MLSRRHLLRLTPLCLLGGLAAGCSDVGDFTAVESLTDDNQVPLPAPQPNTYLLDSGDQIHVTVFGQADLTGDFTVDAAGLVSMPLIDPVPARGISTTDFAHRLETVLRQKLLRNPVVSVAVTQYRPFFILGEVNQPGKYPYVNGMTVKMAAAIAGGFTYRARQSDVLVSRQYGGQTVQGYADLDAPVMPGDTLQVRERYF
jgi:polysaccharide export outer membrane protein